MPEESPQTPKTLPPKRKAVIDFAFQRFALPPIQDALVIGRRAPVGANGVERAFHELTPGMYKLIQVDHPTIEAVLVRASDLRKIPEQELVRRIVEHAGAIMDASDALHVRMDITVIIQGETLEF
jgi:hypothetical protein